MLGPRGDVAWLCFPGWADPAVMAGMLGSGGRYVCEPAGRWVWGGGYEEGSLVWRSRWVSEDGVVECRDALAFPGERTRAVLLRQLQAIRGTPRVRVSFQPAADYGRAGATDLRRDDDGSWHGRLGDNRFRWDGLPEAEPDGDGVLCAELAFEAGETRDLVLVLDTGDPGPALDPRRAWSATEAGWQEACPQLPEVLGERDARHAVAILRGLTCGGGGMVAAATMSLPERAGEGRSYDYRYAWVRDQAMVAEAVAAAGPAALLELSTGWIRDRIIEDGPDLSPAYTDGGGRVPDEVSLGLPGYPGGADVLGNHVNGQLQLDVFGEALLALGCAAERDVLDADGWRAVEIAADAIKQRRSEPDAGIWELDAHCWTHSRLIGAAGLRRVAALPHAKGRAAEWLALADDLVAETARTSLHGDGRWQRTPDDPRIDAALLLPGLRGAVAPGDPRTLATIAAVEAELVEDGYCYRFKPDERPLGDAEGAFLMCGFLMALALQAEGRRDDALRWFERNRAACGPPGLLAEEFDVRQRQLRGNLPQAFVHALLLESAAALA